MHGHFSLAAKKCSKNFYRMCAAILLLVKPFIYRCSFFNYSQRSQYTEKLENETVFLRFGPLSSLIRNVKGTFRSRPANWRSFKKLTFRFRADGKHLENGTLRQQCIHVSLDLPEQFSKMTDDCCVCKFLHLMRFQSETFAVFKFLRSSVLELRESCVYCPKSYLFSQQIIDICK